MKKDIQTLNFQALKVPFGRAFIYADEKHLKALLFKAWENNAYQFQDKSNPVIERTKKQLAEYFAGLRQDFELPTKADGTEFQHKIWAQLKQIDYATTKNYGQIALEIGNKNASRAVGMANGKNPLSIIVPCHRVIGATGTLTGYAGGLKAKQWLLEHERKVSNRLKG